MIALFAFGWHCYELELTIQTFPLTDLNSNIAILKLSTLANELLTSLGDPKDRIVGRLLNLNPHFIDIRNG